VIANEGTINQLIVEKVRIGVANKIKNLGTLFGTSLKVDSDLDFMTDNVIYAFTALLGGTKKETYRHPDGWWQYLKEAYLPMFLKRRFPVKYRSVQVWHMCPHIDLPWTPGNKIHIQFLAGGEEQRQQ
jgi:hypothetical protein